MSDSAGLRCAALLVASMAICAAAPTCRAQVVFDLGAVVGGGDGRGAQLPGNEGRDGVSTETGEFVTGMNFGHTYYVGYQPVAASPYIDGVFNLGGTQITSTGIAYELLPGDASGASFDHISNNRVVGDGPPIRLEGVPYSLGIGIHGGSGITFDLDAFREASGLEAFRFRAQFGTASGGDWRSRGYVVVSSDTEVLIDHVSPIMTSSEAPHEYLVPIPAHARFLTLMAGCGGDFITDDHAAFAAAVLEGCDTEFHSSPELVPFSGSKPLAWTALGIPATSSGARVSVVARGQIGTDTEYLDLKADGIQIASGLFGLGSGTPQCGGSASIATIDLDAALFSRLAADGAIDFVLEPSPSATSAGCPHPELSVHLGYELDPVDCNSNSQSDRCDILNGAADVDGDGHLDVCGRSCRADTNGDRVVDGKDLAAVIVQWGTCYATADCIGDVDGDGDVAAGDLADVLAAWGECPVVVPDWATPVELHPDPAVVYDPELRAAILSTGYAWRVRDTATDIELVLIPPGTFDMGCSASVQSACDSLREIPVHSVTLTRPFYMGRFEVTQAQWAAQTGSNPSWFQESNGFPDSATRPVERVSWSMAGVFAASVGMRLPTEAEWEYACRAGTATAYHGFAAQQTGSDDEADLEDIAWFVSNSGGQTRPVGQKAANGFGLHDMSGNALEWVNDWFDGNYYASSPPVDPPGPASSSHKTVRGGNYETTAVGSRSSARNFGSPEMIPQAGGLRVVKDP